MSCSDNRCKQILLSACLRPTKEPLSNSFLALKGLLQPPAFAVFASSYLGGLHSFSLSGRVFSSNLNGSETPTLVLMSVGGYDTPHISASFSRYDSRRSSGNIPSSYDVCLLFIPFHPLIYATFFLEAYCTTSQDSFAWTVS